MQNLVKANPSQFSSKRIDSGHSRMPVDFFKRICTILHISRASFGHSESSPQRPLPDKHIEERLKSRRWVWSTLSSSSIAMNSIVPVWACTATSAAEFLSKNRMPMKPFFLGSAIMMLSEMSRTHSALDSAFGYWISDWHQWNGLMASRPFCLDSGPTITAIPIHLPLKGVPDICGSG